MSNLYLFLAVTFISCKSISVTSNVVLKNEIEAYGLHNGDTLVDIGCGNGRHAAFISHFYPASYFVLEDIDEKIIHHIDEYYKNTPRFSLYIKERHQIVLGVPDSIPLPSSTYKYLLCRKTFHEFTNAVKMIQEINRIMVVGGKLIIVEIEPVWEGETDRYCKKKLVSKHQIITALQDGNLTLIKSAEITEEKNRKLAVLIFEKK